MSEERGRIIQFPGKKEERQAPIRYQADVFSIQKKLNACLVSVSDDETVFRLQEPSQAHPEREFIIAFGDNGVRIVMGAAEINVTEAAAPLEDAAEELIAFDASFGSLTIYPTGRLKLHTMLPREDFKPLVEIKQPGEKVRFSSNVFSVRFPSDVRRTYPRLYHADQFGEYSLKVGADEDGSVWSVAAFTIEPFPAELTR